MAIFIHLVPHLSKEDWKCNSWLDAHFPETRLYHTKGMTNPSAQLTISATRTHAFFSCAAQRCFHHIKYLSFQALPQVLYPVPPMATSGDMTFFFIYTLFLLLL
jgi:hypothetical protein